jgi:hypothetical protein
MLMLKNLLLLVSCITMIFVTHTHNGIIFQSAAYTGDTIIPFCWAYLLAEKYQIPLYITTPADRSHLKHFEISKRSLSIITPSELAKKKIITVHTDEDIKKHLHDPTVIFQTTLRTNCSFTKDQFLQLKQVLQPIDPLAWEEPPADRITIVMHVRKGVQGVAPWFGALASEQYYTMQPRSIIYKKNPYHPLLYLPRICHKEATDHFTIHPTAFTYFDKVPDWETKYPPEQYYVEALKEVSAQFAHAPLFVRIITDDNKDPQALVLRMSRAVNLANIQFYYKDLSYLTHDERLRSELYALSQHDIYIRSQSYFSRIAEIIGNHHLVYSPLAFMWSTNQRLIMTTVGITESY